MTTNDPIEALQEVLSAVTELSKNVVALTAKLDVSARVAKQSRVVAIVGVVALVVVTCFGYYQWTRVNHAIESAESAIAQNGTNATTACENANETRAANLALWNTVLDLSAQGNPNSEVLGPLRNWITLLYAPHDCTDLTKTYTIPDPPKFPKG